MSERIPPQNIDAERSTIAGTIALNLVPSEIDLQPGDFYRSGHGKIWAAILSLENKGEPLDILSVVNELRTRKQLDDAGGAAYISGMGDEIGFIPYTDERVSNYARIVKDKAVKRRLLSVWREMAVKTYEDALPFEELISHGYGRLLALDSGGDGKGLRKFKDVLKDAIKYIEKLYKSKEVASGISTGFGKLDAYTSGFHGGEYILLAGRPSMGKTALAMKIATNASRQGKKVDVFSMEMSDVQLAMRAISDRTKIDLMKVRSGRLQDSDWPRLIAATGDLSGLEVWTDDTAFLTVAEIERRLKRKQGETDLVIIDYLQLMNPGVRTDSQELATSQISQGLKNMAKRLDVPVVALSQLNRACEERKNKRPMLSDLRYSGCLSGDTLIYLPDSGEYVPISSLVGRTNFTIAAVDDNYKVIRANATKVFSNGVKQLYRLTTGSGRVVLATYNHKLLTQKGWKPLGEIKKGEVVGVPNTLIGPQTSDMSKNELALLGHLIGDGCTLPGHAIQYTTNEPDLAKMVAVLGVKVFGQAIKSHIKYERRWFQVYLSMTAHATHGVRSPIRNWLENLGIFGLRSHEKFVPNRVFRQSDARIAVFLRHLWTTDGSIVICKRPTRGNGKHPTRKPPSARLNIYYATSSRQLAYGIRSLLLRMGINSRVGRVSQKKKGRMQYHVTIIGLDGKRRFAEVVGIAGVRKHAKLFSMIELLAERGDDGSMRKADIYWDRVKSVVPSTDEEVFDISVDGPHNFVANDVMVHNSLEQDADVVLFIYRDEKYCEKCQEGAECHAGHEGLAEVIIAKQRNGPTGFVSLTFLPESASFEERAEEPPVPHWQD